MVIECITYLIKNTLYIFLILFLLNRIIGYKLKIRKVPLVIFSLASLAATLGPFLAIDDLSLARDTADISTLFLIVSVPYCTLEHKKKLTFFWFSFFLNSVFDLYVTIVSSALKINYHFHSNIIYIVLLLICLFIASRFYKNNYTVSSDFFEKIPPIVYITVFIASLSTYYTMMLPESSDFSDRASRFLIVIAAVIVIFCLTYIAFKFLSVVLKQRDSLTQLDMQVKHYEELSEKNQSIRRFRHDISNNMFALSSLIENGEYEEAQEYIKDMNYEIRKSENRFSTGNNLADAIISKKYDDARKHGIDIAFTGAVPSKKISSSDLCIMLANPLDNAIRACADIAPCTIEIEALINKNGFTLTVINPVKSDVEIKNNSVKTSKADKENHGLGIGNIKKTAEKYGGTVLLSCEDRIFTLKIILPE